jgi:hypothetical protein
VSDGEDGQFRHCHLYGRADGTWAVLQSPDGWMIPPRVGDLRHMGDATTAILGLYLQIPGAGAGRGAPPAQHMIARLTGLGQTTVSLHVRESGKLPPLDDDGWRALTRLLYAWTEWPDKPCDREAVGEFLASGDRIKAELAGGPG